jgi:hypothetical protein
MAERNEPETLIQKLEEIKNLSRIRRFSRREAIRYIPKFALANLMHSN